MGKVIVELSMSLDGYVAGPNDGLERPLGDGGEQLFAWYASGNTPLRLPGTEMKFMVAPESAALLQEEWSSIGAMVAGRRMFDIARAWGGKPPVDGPCFILTHNPPQEWVKPGSPFIFITDGIEMAIRQARQAANGKDISISSASIMQQCIRAGLLDEIHIDLAPVLLGGGIRLFDHLGNLPIQLRPILSLATADVTHLRYQIVQ